jgi:hypothetical protein
MMRIVLAGILAVVLGGCAGMTGPDGVFYRQSQQVRLSRATTMMEEGKPAAAKELLAGICAEKGVQGVTDEALFRLSLLRLDAAQPGDDVPLALQDLRRLRKEYPSSAWTPLAALLAGYLTSTEDVKQQEAKLKEMNSSLAKENKELRQRLEKLKNLELELGKGAGPPKVQ